MWYIHVMGYYFASKRKEILTYTTAQMNAEDIMFIAKSATKRQRLYVSTCMRYLE